MVTDSAQAHRFWMASLLHIPSLVPASAAHSEMPQPIPTSPRKRPLRLAAHGHLGIALPYLSLLLYAC